MGEPFTKRPLSYHDQVALLRERGLTIDRQDAAEFYLAQLNYYRLAAYWLPFEADHTTHTFRKDATFERVLALYVFDRELRLLVLDAMERVEVAVRARWAYELAHAHGPHAHLKPELHRRPEAYAEDRESLRKCIERAKRQEIFIRHLTGKYEEPLPALWAACEVMPFGLLSRWYENLSDNHLRAKIAGHFKVPHKQLASWLRHLSIIRNVCAHHNRLWNREFTVTPSAPKTQPAEITVRWHHGSRQLYNALLILHHLMDIVAPEHSWGERLREHLVSLDAPGGLQAMGFPEGVGPDDL